MLRRVVVALAVVPLVAVGCSDSESGGATVTVDVDGKTDAFVGSFIDYFPKEVTVRQGDTIDFKSIWTGEAHTVTLGTLVDKGLAESDANPDAPEEPPSLQLIPELLPEGPGNANQAAAQPCFLASGDPPAEEPCPEDAQQQPDFDGTQTYYNSGWLEPDQVFKVDLADDIEPGVYRYFCTLHRAGQQGKITVVDQDGDGQSASEVSQAGQAQLQAIVDQLTPIATAMKTGTLPPLIPAPLPGTVISGGVAQGSTGIINEFGPKDFSVAVGGSVTWPTLGPHTVSFNVPPSAATYISKAPDGTVNLNPEALAAAGGPGVPPGPPPTPPEGQPYAVIDGGSFDGAGFRSSGFLPSFPPNLLAYKLTFTKAGTYSYSCIIHPGMVGSIKVG